MSLIFHQLDDDIELIRRTDLAKRAVALYAPGVSVVVARSDGTDQTSLKCESRGHAAQVALGCGLEIICETSMASHQDDCGIDEAPPGRNWARDARVAGRGTRQATNLSTTKESES